MEEQRIEYSKEWARAERHLRDDSSFVSVTVRLAKLALQEPAPSQADYDQVKTRWLNLIVSPNGGSDYDDHTRRYRNAVRELIENFVDSARQNAANYNVNFGIALGFMSTRQELAKVEIPKLLQHFWFCMTEARRHRAAKDWYSFYQFAAGLIAAAEKLGVSLDVLL